MKKYFRVFLCLLFAVVLPFSCFGCKSKGAGNGNLNGGDNSSNNPEQSKSYVLNENEVIRLLKVSSEYSESFVEKFNNNAEFLSQNNYESLFGLNTASMINYSFYPKSIIETLIPSLESKATPSTFTLGNVYYYLSGGLEQRYILVDNIEDKEVCIKVVSYDTVDLLYLKYNFYIDKGEINALNIAKYTAPTSGASLDFVNTYIDFKNETIRASFGGLLSLTSSNAEKLFKNYFTKDKFDDIPKLENGWSYSYYENIDFKEFEYETSTEVGSEQIVQDFDNFKFLDTYDTYYAYQEMYPDNMEKNQDYNMGSDIFAVISANSNFYRYSSDGFKFEKK